MEARHVRPPQTEMSVKRGASNDFALNFTSSSPTTTSRFLTTSLYTMLCSIALLITLGSSLAFPSASAFGTSHFQKRQPLEPRSSTSYNDYTTEYYFEQLIDHSNPSAGTFKQRYFFSDQYYGGQGSPIIIGTPGEQSADGFYTDLTGYSMMHAMLETWGAAGVVLERTSRFSEFLTTAETDEPTWTATVRFYNRSLLRQVITIHHPNRPQPRVSGGRASRCRLQS